MSIHSYNLQIILICLLFFAEITYQIIQKKWVDVSIWCVLIIWVLGEFFTSWLIVIMWFLFFWLSYLISSKITTRKILKFFIMVIIFSLPLIFYLLHISIDKIFNATRYYGTRYYIPGSIQFNLRSWAVIHLFIIFPSYLILLLAINDFIKKYIYSGIIKMIIFFIVLVFLLNEAYGF